MNTNLLLITIFSSLPFCAFVTFHIIRNKEISLSITALLLVFGSVPAGIFIGNIAGSFWVGLFSAIVILVVGAAVGGRVEEYYD